MVTPDNSPTPLSEAVARLTSLRDELRAEPWDAGEMFHVGRPDRLAMDLTALLDAVAEGREKITEVLPMLEQANSDLMWIESGHFDSVEEVVSEISDAASHVSDAVFTLKQAFPPPPAPTEPGQ